MDLDEYELETYQSAMISNNNQKLKIQRSIERKVSKKPEMNEESDEEDQEQIEIMAKVKL